MACLFVCEPGKLRGDALINCEIVQRMGLGLIPTGNPAAIKVLDYNLRNSELVVDALLGTGFSGEPRPPMDAAIRAINASGRRVVAIDVPSGMDCDTGQAAGPCLKAWRTITFVAMKPAFLVPGANEITGDVFVADIGAPVKLIDEVAANNRDQ